MILTTDSSHSTKSPNAKTNAAPLHAALRLDQIRKCFTDFTVSADWSVQPGERCALVGRSGSGKTTLLRVVAGLSDLTGPGDGGRVWLGDRDLTPLPPEKRNFGVVFQDQALFPTLSVLENAAFGLKIRGMGKAEREAEVLPWLERVGLKARAQSGVERLSGGERQRLAFVRAFVWKPQAMLLDEPFSALDDGLRRTLRSELVELHRLWPVPLLMITHDEADLQAIAATQIAVQEEEGAGARRFVKGTGIGEFGGA